MSDVFNGQVSRRLFLLRSMAGLSIPALMLRAQQQPNPQTAAQNTEPGEILIGEYVPLIKVG
jgi:hypothetical protein